MWSRVRNAVSGVAEQAGIDVPGLSVDSGALAGAGACVGDAVRTSVDEAAAAGTDEAATVADPVADAVGVAGDAASGALSGASDAVSGAAEGAVASGANLLDTLTGLFRA